MQTTSLTVNGITCEGCEDRIARAVRSLAGISDIRADHRSGSVQVVFDPARVSNDAIRTAIERAGYEVAA